MKKAFFLAALPIGIGFATPAMATDFSFVGSLADPNEVQLFEFFVPADSTVTLRTWSYAGGTNAAGDIIVRGGFDPILALFNSVGALIGQNDDGGLNVMADAVTGQRFDTFFQQNLAAGNYTVSVMAFSNFANGPNLSDGFGGGGSFTDFVGDRRTNAWAFDILNVGEAVQVGGVPEPATWAMLLLGFGFVGGAMRSAKRQQKTTVSYA